VWWQHQQELLSIYEGTQSEHIPLLVVVFPNMNRSEESLVISQRVANLFEERDVPVLNVADLIENVPVDECIASPVDPHPSELVHHLVAEELYKMFVELGLTETAKVQ
jgi:hypothetical protein